MSLRTSSTNTSERTPLLSREDEESQPNFNAQVDGTAESDDPVPPIPSYKRKHRRWPSIITLIVLCLLVLLACFGFAAPSIAQEYAKEALIFEPDRLSIDSFTSFGIRARIQGDLWLDASRVHRKHVRDLGRLTTWLAREVESGESEVKVYIPRYDNILLGTAKMPPVKVNVRNLHYNHLDILTDMQPGDVDGIRTVAKDFLDGRVKQLDVKAVAQVTLKTGLVKLGTQTVSQQLKFEGHDMPDVPKFNVEKLRFAEYGPPGHPDGVKAMASVSLMNDYPLNFDVPPLGFDVLLPDCVDDYLLLATARTDVIHILPKHSVNVSGTGLIRQLPTSLTTACPDSSNSPLDTIVGDYLAGRDATVFIRGGEQNQDTPAWVGKLLRETTVPFSLPGHPFDNLIKNFSLAHVHFSLPDPLANDAHPKISAVVKVLVGLPEEMNVNLDVDRVRADADVFYKGDRLGKLDLRKWQTANATKLESDLLIESVVDEAPLEITDDAVFSKVVQALVFGGDGVQLGVKASIDANTLTALGEFVVRNIPAEGKIFVKPIRRDGFGTPSISDLQIVDTSDSAIVLQATANITNPTDYSAHVPCVNVSIFVNETRVGYAWASADVAPGPNSVVVRVAWGVGNVSREWLSQFVSGYNTSFTVRTHPGSLPSIPDPGLELTIPTPHLFGKFLKEATMHLFSSTATFLLSSPFALSITSIAAQAFHNGTEIGSIAYEYPFDIGKGVTETPRLPVEWGLDGLGTVREALGGSLKLDARAEVDVKIGEWGEHLWYEGHGIGAKVKL